MRKKLKESLYDKDTCPARSKHSKEPEGYLQWHAFAEEKSKTHRQIRCQTCGLYVIWVKRKKHKQLTKAGFKLVRSYLQKKAEEQQAIIDKVPVYGKRWTSAVDEIEEIEELLQEFK